MKLIYITSAVTPYRIAFCDSINDYLIKSKKGVLKCFLLTQDKFNSNYNDNLLNRSYTEILKGKTVVLRDHTTRFMINPDIAKKVAAEKADFVILGGSWTNPSTWILLANKEKLEIPIYFWAESHFHNGINRKKRKLWKELIKKYIYNKFDGFFIPGLYAREAIESTHCTNCNKCIQLPNLIEDCKYAEARKRRENKIQLRNLYGIKRDAIVLFTPARLVDLKGILEFLENGRYELENSHITWVIAGLGPLKDDIINKAENYSIDIKLTGFVEQEKMISYYALADWFVLPSLSDPNPLTVIEALWAGLPIILSKYVGNAPEALIEGRNGYLFDTLMKEDVVKTIQRIKKATNEWRIEAGKISEKIAAEKFNMAVETQKLISEIEQIVG